MMKIGMTDPTTRHHTENDTDFKEECFFLFGIKLFKFYLGILKPHSVGEKDKVEFSWKKAVKAHFLLGFFHTHPPMCLYCSSQDRETMYAWVMAEGRPLLCGILCDGHHLTYLFHKNTMEKVKSKLYGRYFLASLE